MPFPSPWWKLLYRNYSSLTVCTVCNMYEADTDFEHDDYDINSRHTEKHLLVWQKIDIKATDFAPACREGHTSEYFDKYLYIFGGIENNERVNTLLCCRLDTKCWEKILCKGEIPRARSFHASCLLGNFMIIHGGELGNTSQAGDSIDEMYALDLISYTWMKLSQQLGPLACYGHSMNIVNMVMAGESVECLLVVGGYNSHLNACNSSIFVCETRDILREIKSWKVRHNLKIEAEPAAAQCFSSIRWRSLKCEGKAPPPRYRHSACLIPIDETKSNLIIFGGIFLNPSSPTRPSKPVNDLYILDIAKLSWITPFAGNDALADGIHVIGPPPIFGHVAIPFKAKVSHFELVSKTLDVNSGRYDMLIYAGGTNVAKSSSGCQHTLYQFNTDSHTWTKANTGYLFPPERCGHSISICNGWSPFYNYPAKQVSVASAVMNEERSMGSTDISLDKLKSCAIIFSGVSSLSRPADIWCLDITPGRRSGVNQFDYCVSNLIDHPHANTTSTNQAIMTLRKPNKQFSGGILSPWKEKTARKDDFLGDIDLETIPNLRLSPGASSFPDIFRTYNQSGHSASGSEGGSTVNSVLFSFQSLHKLGAPRNQQSMRSFRPSSFMSLSNIPEENNLVEDISDFDFESIPLVDYDDEGDEENDGDLMRTNSNLSSLSSETVRVISGSQDELELLSYATAPRIIADSKINAVNSTSASNPVSSNRVSIAKETLLSTLQPTKSFERRLTKQPSGLKKVVAPKSKDKIEKEEVGTAYLKCKIQRAMADINTEFERGQAAVVETRCENLENEIETLKESLQKLRENKVIQEAAVKEAIGMSRENVRLLATVNLEAARLCRLLMIQG